MKEPWTEVLRLTISYFLFALVACTPVQADTEPGNEQASQVESRAIVLVIDKSGSMREQNKMHYAKELAKAIGRQLSDSDYLGVPGFPSSSDEYMADVVIPLDQVMHLRQQDLINEKIDRLRPGGQTYFLPALKRAMREIEGANANRKHVILISDGETSGAQKELFDAVVAIKKLAIRVSTIALGADGNTAIMRRTAHDGGGSFQLICDPSDLAHVTLESIVSGDTAEIGVGIDHCPTTEKP